ncbi:hypothetical protein FRX31_009954 [Thalictrum thalictroides]|uniref:KIB1-4 beta-propeller domain-containing protein n=1 Tax=Thalictrum thalictroides TaxID=46969 RepID=A0A7J6WVE4_THATH|nr:hypothetical protein FRX31_009954 [Thalictrum thalictroides]
MSTSSSSSREPQHQQQQQQSCPDWSELNEDLLEMVAKRLYSIEDFYNFGGVCSSWRSVTLSIRKHKNTTLPWLMLVSDFEDTHRDFYSVVENKTYRSNYPNKAFYGCQSWGSSFGWLVSLDYKAEAHGLFYLLNPLSPMSPRLALPSLWNLPDEERAVLSRWYTYKAAVFKLGESSVDNHDDQFLVFAIYGTYRNLAYSKPGDHTWTGVTFPYTNDEINRSALRQGQLDILHLNGQFYSVDYDGRIWLLRDIDSAAAADDGGTTNPPTAIRYAFPPPMCERLRRTCAKILSLIEMEGELHVAVRFQDYYTRKTVLIEIFKCDASTRKWQKLKTLGDYALFLGACTSISVKASDYSTPICKPNHIYFCYQDFYNKRTQSPQPDMGILDFDRHVVSPMNAEHKFTQLFSAPAWVIPNLL